MKIASMLGIAFVMVLLAMALWTSIAVPVRGRRRTRGADTRAALLSDRRPVLGGSRAGELAISAASRSPVAWRPVRAGWRAME